MTWKFTECSFSKQALEIYKRINSLSRKLFINGPRSNMNLANVTKYIVDILETKIMKSWTLPKVP